MKKAQQALFARATDPWTWSCSTTSSPVTRCAATAGPYPSRNPPAMARVRRQADRMWLQPEAWAAGYGEAGLCGPCRGAGEQQRRGRRQRQRRQQQQAANGPAASAIAPASQAGVLRRTVARGEPDTTMATTAKRGRLRATAASYVLVRGVLKTSTQRLPRDMRVHYAPGCSRRGLAWHRP